MAALAPAAALFLIQKSAICPSAICENGNKSPEVIVVVIIVGQGPASAWAFPAPIRFKLLHKVNGEFCGYVPGGMKTVPPPAAQAAVMADWTVVKVVPST